MADNYDRILDFIEKSTDGKNIDSEEFHELIKGISSFDKRELVRYCQAKLKKNAPKLVRRNLKYLILGVFLATLMYIPLSFLFPGLLANNFLTALFVFNCISVVFLLRPKNHPLVKQESKYLKFKSKFSRN